MATFNFKAEGNKIYLSGQINENADLSGLKEISGDLIFSFKGITRINSCGVREWVNLLKVLSGRTIIFEDCPVVIVRQINSVPDFLGDCKISSLELPLFCEACSEETSVYIKIEEIEGIESRQFKCEKCKGEASMDVMPKQYFKFLKA